MSAFFVIVVFVIAVFSRSSVFMRLNLLYFLWLLGFLICVIIFSLLVYSGHCLLLETTYKIEGGMGSKSCRLKLRQQASRLTMDPEEVFRFLTFYPVLSQQSKQLQPLWVPSPCWSMKHSLMVQCQTYPWIFTNLCQPGSSQGLL